jgi:4-aminobutyrate aminotransferase
VSGSEATRSDLGVRRPLDRTMAALRREDEHLAEIMKIRFYPFVLERARGNRLFDVDGNEYLDFVAAGSAMNVGYANERVAEAVKRAMADAWSTTSAIFAHDRQTELAARLAAMIDGDVKVWFGTSGSEAMDVMGRYFRTASGRPRMISFQGSFHGQTGGSGALSGMSSHDDIPSDYVTKVPYPTPYRCEHGPCRREGCSLRCLDPLRAAVESSADETAGIVVEPIASDGGDVIPPDNFLPALRELCDAHGLWLGIDEIKVGLGRTGSMFAHAHTGVRPDAVAVGKSLAGGLPLSALIGRREILDAATGTCAHTLAGSPIPCAAALATLDELDQGLVEHAASIGELLLARLQERLARADIVGEVRGRGLLVGIELVTDRVSRDPAGRHAAAVVYRCFELGLITIYTGVDGNVIELTPPLALTEADAELAAELIEQAIDDVSCERFDLGKLSAYQGW